MSSNGSPYDTVSDAQATINEINSVLYENDRDQRLKENKKYYCEYCGETPLIVDKRHKKLCGKIKCKNPRCRDTLYGTKEIENGYCKDCQENPCQFCDSLNCVVLEKEYNDDNCHSLRRKFTLCIVCGKVTMQFPKIKTFVEVKK